MADVTGCVAEEKHLTASRIETYFSNTAHQAMRLMQFDPRQTGAPRKRSDRDYQYESVHHFAEPFRRPV